MTKRKIYNYIQLGLWIAAFIGLIVIIALPKESESLLKTLYYVFIGLILVIPGLLSFVNVLNYALEPTNKKETFTIMPFIGLSAYTLLTLIYFLKSINSQGKLIMILALLVFLIISGLLIYFIMKRKDYHLRQHAIFLIINYVLYFAFFFLGVQISYYYSLNW